MFSVTKILLGERRDSGRRAILRQDGSTRPGQFPLCTEWPQPDLLAGPQTSAGNFSKERFMDNARRLWVDAAVEKLNADVQRSSDTHLFRLPLPSTPGVDLYLKDESTHLTGSLKHRLARSLFLYALCNGRLGPDTAVVEASSGSTAVSEAYFAQLLGLRFLAVMARETSPEKVRRIERYGGECLLVAEAGVERSVAQTVAGRLQGHFMDQFTFAERATDWRGNNNIAESIFAQMAREPHPTPKWVVCGAGTGGTSATIGRYIRYCRLKTALCVVDPPLSVLHSYWETGDAEVAAECGSGIEGIGRPRVPASFVREVVDRMIVVPNAASLAAMLFLEARTGRRCGPSTGTNLCGAFELIAEMHAAGESGSVVTLICDSGELYRETYYDAGWRAAQGYSLDGERDRLTAFYETGGLRAV
jgi:cysteine synthase A